MYDRKNFKNFINETVAPNTKTTADLDLRVDQYGNFKIYFIPCVCKSDKWANSNAVAEYGDLGKMLISGKDMHRFIRSINDVEMNINLKPLEMPGASYALHRLMPMNSNPTLTMMWLSTKTPFVETVFVPWMQDNTINGKCPLIKVDMEIKFPLLSDAAKNIVYKYYGIRPIEIGLHKMSNEAQTDFYRKVTFDFDYFWIETRKTEVNNNL